MKARIVALGGVAVMVALAVTLIAWQAVQAQPDGDVQAVQRPTPTPAPSEPLAVEEQNLDESGLIRVHEQGVVDVNVVSQPTPPPLALVLSETVSGNREGQTSLVSTEACSEFVAMATRVAGGGSIGINTVYTSPDGAVTIPASPRSVMTSGDGTSSTFSFLGAFPFVAFNIAGQEAFTAEVWLFCR